jgi:hypothetical protein
VTGHSDEGGGYLQLRDNKRLRSQARSLIAAGLDDGTAFSLLRRSNAMNQQEAKGPIMEHFLKAGCGARPTEGQSQDEKGSWAPSEEWWSKDQEIAMCHTRSSTSSCQKKKKAGERANLVEASVRMASAFVFKNGASAPVLLCLKTGLAL